MQPDDSSSNDSINACGWFPLRTRVHTEVEWKVVWLQSWWPLAQREYFLLDLTRAAESSNVRIKKSALMPSSRDLYVCSCLPGTFYLGPVEEKVESLLRERNNVLSICHFRFTWPKDAFPSRIVNKVWNSLTSMCRQAILWSYHQPRESSWDPNAQYQLLERPDWTHNIFSALTSPHSWTYRE